MHGCNHYLIMNNYVQGIQIGGGFCITTSCGSYGMYGLNDLNLVTERDYVLVTPPLVEQMQTICCNHQHGTRTNYQQRSIDKPIEEMS